jgi:hypothetical protein
MIIIPFLMLTVPGLIAMRIHKSKEELLAENRILLICEYMIYSLAIIFISYLFMFLTYPARTVSFSLTQTYVSSGIYSASFVVKYSFISVLAAVLLAYVTDFALSLVLSISGYFERVKNVAYRNRKKDAEDRPIR